MIDLRPKRVLPALGLRRFAAYEKVVQLLWCPTRWLAVPGGTSAERTCQQLLCFRPGTRAGGPFRFGITPPDPALLPHDLPALSGATAWCWEHPSFEQYSAGYALLDRLQKREYARTEDNEAYVLN